MLFALPLAAMGLAVAADTMNPGAGNPDAEHYVVSPVSAPGLAASPLAGRWSLDVARVPEEERPQSVSIDFGLSSDGRWTTRVEIVAADGTSSHALSIARPDGVAVPVSGTMGYIDTASLRQPEANTLVMTLAKDGAPFSTRVYTVSDDGQSMTETIIWPGSEVPELETTYFSRVR